MVTDAEPEAVTGSPPRTPSPTVRRGREKDEGEKGEGGKRGDEEDQEEKGVEKDSKNKPAGVSDIADDDEDEDKLMEDQTGPYKGLFISGETKSALTR